MRELEYPFDSEYIMSKKRRLKKELLSNDDNRIRKKVAILGGSTTNDIKLVLELFLLNNGIYPEFYESEYNKFYEDVMFDNSELINFAPDIIYIHTTNRNIMTYPDITDSAENVECKLKDEMQRFVSVWDKIAKVYKCPVIQNNFEMPLFRLLGNLDASDIHGRVNYINRLNQQFYEYAQNNKNFYICDINYISADYGLSEWSDPFYWYMYKYALNVSAIPYLAYNVSNIIKSIFGRNKKGIVLDLDNTLWGGVIGDDGINNIEIGKETASGEAYTEFQEYIKLQKSIGVLLTVNSKNEYENAIEGLRYKENILKPDDFVIIKANWNQKDINIKETAAELNLLEESLVFIDDNPVEREIVRSNIKGIQAPELQEVYSRIQLIDHAGFFETTDISEDDISRVHMYKENIERKQAQAMFDNYKDFLASLDMTAVIGDFEPVHYARIVQLVNKSNQFNLTTKRYTQNEIEFISDSLDYISIYGRLEDKYGDNGIVSVIIGKIENNICHLELWLMSCRVLKRDMELAMMDAIVKECQKRDITCIRGYYYPTKKNNMVKDLYGELGFEKTNQDCYGNTNWEYKITPEYSKKNCVIRVEE